MKTYHIHNALQGTKLELNETLFSNLIKDTKCDIFYQQTFSKEGIPKVIILMPCSKFYFLSYVLEDEISVFEIIHKNNVKHNLYIMNDYFELEKSEFHDCHNYYKNGRCIICYGKE